MMKKPLIFVVPIFVAILLLPFNFSIYFNPPIPQRAYISFSCSISISITLTGRSRSVCDWPRSPSELIASWGFQCGYQPSTNYLTPVPKLYYITHNWSALFCVISRMFLLPFPAWAWTQKSYVLPNPVSNLGLAAAAHALFLHLQP